MKLDLKRATAYGIGTTLLVGLIAFAVLGAGGIVAWEYSNSDAFCANVCHSVHPEETRAHNNSVHARVNCVECHMGRLSTLHLMALKPTHAKELWGMIVGYERPLESTTLRPASDNCEACHWPSVVHRDTIVLKKHYATDPESSETTYRLTLHTGVGVVREKMAKGIHWHITNNVSYITTDPQRRTIPWVQIKDADGKVVSTYVDATAKLSPDELKKLEPRRVECADCHNQAGHPFENPEDRVDHSIADGRIDRSIPGTKARAVALIGEASKLYGWPDQLSPKIAQMIAASTPKDLKPDEKEAEKKFESEMQKILVASSFTREGLSWKSFPNQVGHKDSLGCFRCHDGKHLNEKGQAIRLQCTLCHDLPQVTRENGEGSVPSTVMAGVTPPESHDEPNFMHDHRFKFDQSCTMCHGKKLEFGRDGGNFCANPACHGRKWPGVNLSVKSSG